MSLTIAQGTFTTSGSTGPQVVSHSLGTTPIAFYFYGNGHMSASGLLNFRQGFDDLTHRRSVGYNAGDSGGSIFCETGFSDQYSLLLVRNSVSSQISATGYVSAVSSTTFTVQWDTAGSVTGQVWRYWAIGGSGVTAEVGSISPPGSPGTQTTTFGLSDPRVLLNFYCPGVGSQTSSGGSLQSMGLGIAVACGELQAVAACYDTDLADPTVNKTLQLTTAGFLSIDGTGTPTNQGAVSNWTTNSIDVDWTARASSNYFSYLVLGGTLAANLITITQPTSTGSQRSTYTIAQPAGVLTFSTSKVAGGSATSGLSWTIGSADSALHQGAVWCGDTNGQASPAWAVELEGDTTDLVVTGTPTSSSTATFPAGGPLTDLSQGSLGIDWTAADSTARQWIALILGADTSGLPCGGAAPPTITRFATRRERIFSLPFDTNLEVFLERLEILVQSGVGLSTGQGSDPVILLSISRDGGHSFGNEIQLGVGKIGEYQRRAYANRLGRGRNLVCKVACSDPVFFAFLAAYVNANVGTS